MSLFFDYLWIWFVLTFVAGIGGGALYFGDQRGRNLVIAVILPLLTLALGLTLYYGIDTDRKSIVRMLDALVAAVDRNDPDTVCLFISPKAEDIRKYARAHMLLFDISRAKYHGLEVEVNDAASPPIAHIRFAAMFYWKNKLPIEGMLIEQPILESGRFEAELVKASESWLITKLDHSFRRSSFGDTVSNLL